MCISRKKRPLRLLRRIVSLIIPKHQTIWSVPFDGAPSIFVCNHAREYGPAVMYSHFDFPYSLRPWVASEMCKIKLLPKYVRGDFWWKQDQWYSKILNRTIPYIVALPLTGIFKRMQAIPVYRDKNIAKTISCSVDALKNGDNILIFPEKPVSYGEYGAVLNGFVTLAYKFSKKTSQSINIYPVYACLKRRKICVGAPIAYDHDDSYESQKALLPRLVVQRICGLKDGDEKRTEA